MESNIVDTHIQVTVFQKAISDFCRRKVEIKQWYIMFQGCLLYRGSTVLRESWIIYKDTKIDLIFS